MTIALIASIILAVVGMAASASNANQANETQKELQEDSQEFNAEQAQLSRDYQVSYYRNFESPEAKYNQYRDLGASENAALQAVLGVSPSVVTAPTASSGLGAASMANPSFISGLMDSLLNAAKAPSDIQNTNADTDLKLTNAAYIPRVNQSMIDKSYSDIQTASERLNLDRDILDNVTLPALQSTLDLNRTEILKRRAETSEIFKKIDEVEQMISESQSRQREIDKNIESKLRRSEAV